MKSSTIRITWASFAIAASLALASCIASASPSSLPETVQPDAPVSAVPSISSPPTDTSEKLETKIEEKDGKKTVTTIYTEGTLAGKTKKMETFRDDGILPSTTEFFYDSAGHKVRETTENSQGGKMVVTFHAEGSLAGERKKSEWFNDDILASTTEYFYETEGAAAGKLKKEELGYEGKIINVTEYFYDAEGNKTHEVREFGRENKSVTTYHTEGKVKGNQKVRESFHNGKLSETWKKFYDSEGNQTHSVYEHSSGSKLVDTYYTEGKAKGKSKGSESISSKGIPTDRREHFYDGDGENTHSVFARTDFSNRSERRFYYLSNREKKPDAYHVIDYKNVPIDESKGVVYPDPLPPFPISSGYFAKNTDLAVAVSDGTITVTLKNVSDSPIEVHEDVFMSPSFRLDLGGKGMTFGRPPPSGSWTKTQPDEIRRVISLAPGESLRYETTLPEVIKTLPRFVEAEHASYDSLPVSLSLRYENLFPLPPEAQSGSTGFDKAIPLGTLGEFKAKHPELFETPDKPTPQNEH